MSSTSASTKTIFLAKPATLLPVPPVDISISKFVLGEIDFKQSFISINRLCFHFLFSPDDPVDPNEAVSFIGAPGLDGAGFINVTNYPRYSYNRCFTSDYTTRLFVDGQEYFGVRMDHGFGADPEGTTIIESIEVDVEAVVYALYLPIVAK